MKEELRHIMEVEKNGRVYTFSLQMGSPIGEAYDACHEFLLRLVDEAQRKTEKEALKNGQLNVSTNTASKES